MPNKPKSPKTGKFSTLGTAVENVARATFAHNENLFPEKNIEALRLDQIVSFGETPTPATKTMRVILAQPRGFCPGIERALDIVERALIKFGPPIYVRHDFVDNRHVVEDLRARGVMFVDELDRVPDGAMTVFSPHGVARKVEKAAANRALPVIDATCPLVTKVHAEGRRYAREGHEIVLIGHAGHTEVEGTIGQIDGTVHLVQTIEDVTELSVKNPDKLSYITQTTLSVDDTRDMIVALKSRYPGIVGPDLRDICHATKIRQEAVRHLAELADLILVVGSKNSFNSLRLRQIGAEFGRPSYLIDDASHLQSSWFEGVHNVGVTSGPSVPEVLVQEIIEGLMRFIGGLGGGGQVKVALLGGTLEDVKSKSRSRDFVTGDTTPLGFYSYRNDDNVIFPKRWFRPDGENEEGSLAPRAKKSPLSLDVEVLIQRHGYAAVSNEIAKYASSLETASESTRLQAEAVLENSTLGKLLRRYNELLRSVELPSAGLKTLEQARAAARLSSTYDSLVEEQVKLGFEPSLKDDRVTEARRLRAEFYRQRKNALRPTPVRAGRPRKPSGPK